MQFRKLSLINNDTTLRMLLHARKPLVEQLLINIYIYIYFYFITVQ
jgi:hypothetical protein